MSGRLGQQPMLDEGVLNLRKFDVGGESLAGIRTRSRASVARRGEQEVDHRD